MVVNILAFVIIGSAAVFVLSQAEPLGSRASPSEGLLLRGGDGEHRGLWGLPYKHLSPATGGGDHHCGLQHHPCAIEIGGCHTQAERLAGENFKTRKHKRHVVICGVVAYGTLILLQLLSEESTSSKDLGSSVCLSPVHPHCVPALLQCYKQHIQFLIDSSKTPTSKSPCA